MTIAATTTGGATNAPKLSFFAAALVLGAVMISSIVVAWSAAYRYGIDKTLASNFFWIVFIGVYCGALALPWLNLKGQEQLSRAQRKEKMCIVWLFLIMMPHLFWEMPWVLFYQTIMNGRDQLWAYAWWAYMDGGDMRYVTRDIYLVAMETGASLIGLTVAYLLLQHRKHGAFTKNQLLIIMVLMVADFYPTYMYYVTEIFTGLPNVHGSLNFIIKFVGSNSFWLVMPLVVFLWAGKQLTADRGQ